MKFLYTLKRHLKKLCTCWIASSGLENLSKPFCTQPTNKVLVFLAMCFFYFLGALGFSISFSSDFRFGWAEKSVYSFHVLYCTMYHPTLLSLFQNSFRAFWKNWQALMRIGYGWPSIKGLYLAFLFRSISLFMTFVKLQLLVSQAQTLSKAYRKNAETWWFSRTALSL